jgi:hypothetical protein
LCATTYRWRRGRSRVRDRPLVLKRFVDGAEGEAFYQKRAPENRPSWLRTVTLSFPSGRTAEEIVVDNAGGLAWTVNLGCIELHPHPVRSGDLEHPDELRVDLDPSPGVAWGSGSIPDNFFSISTTSGWRGIRGSLSHLFWRQRRDFVADEPLKFRAELGILKVCA